MIHTRGVQCMGKSQSPLKNVKRNTRKLDHEYLIMAPYPLNHQHLQKMVNLSYPVSLIGKLSTS